MKRNKKDAKKAGDVLGISDTPATTQLPRATEDHGGHARGIEIGQPPARHTGFDELNQSKGATGIDMGAGGSGTDIDIPGATPGEHRRE